MTRPLAEIHADLAASAARTAELHRELAAALRADGLHPGAVRPASPAAASPEYLTTAEAADVLGVSTRTLEALRASGSGPAYVRVGKAIRYPAATLRG